MTEFVLAVLPLALVIIGWRVLYANARKIASRSETNSIVQVAISGLNDIERLAESYWFCTRVLSPNQYERLCLAKVMQLMIKLDLLALRNLTVRDELLTNLRQSLTLKIDPQSELDGSPAAKGIQIIKLNQVIISTAAIESELYRNFNKLYPPEN